MRTVTLSKIINRKVTEFNYDGESIYLSFEGDVGLAVHNERVMQPSTVDEFKSVIVNKYVLEIDEQNDSIEFIFDNDTSLKVLLDDDSYYGPEAMELRIPNEPIVIWN